MTARDERPDGPVHLHINNYTRLDDVFEATPERVDAALARFPSLSGRVKVTIARDGEGFEQHMRTARVLFTWDVPRRQGLAELAPRLRWIHAHGAGVSHLMPLDWLPRGVDLTNSRGVHAQRGAEYALMAVLMINNRVPEMVTHQRSGRWRQCFNSSLEGKTLLIVGVGHVGSSVAPWAKRLGMRVLGTRRSARRRRFVDEMHAPEALPSLLPRADIVLVTCPLTAQTFHLLGAAELDLMKPGAGLVNYSRANLVDYEALRGKLERGELSAVLDVFDPEPLPAGSPLWHTPNLIITPHCSSDDTEQYTPRTLDVVFRNIERFIEGRPLTNRVSRKHEY